MPAESQCPLPCSAAQAVRHRTSDLHKLTSMPTMKGAPSQQGESALLVPAAKFIVVTDTTPAVPSMQHARQGTGAECLTAW